MRFVIRPPTIRPSTLEAIAKVGRPIFAQEGSWLDAPMSAAKQRTGAFSPTALPLPPVRPEVATFESSCNRTEPLKSYLDNERGVEWVPLKAVGWPKRMVVLRRERGSNANSNAWLSAVEKRLSSVSEYTRAPIRWLSPDQSLEVVRYDVDTICAMQ